MNQPKQREAEKSCSLYTLVEFGPYPFANRKEQLKRRMQIIGTYYEKLPSIAFAFFFGVSPSSLHQWMERHSLKTSRSQSLKLFHAFLKRKNFDDLVELRYPERLYLIQLREALAKAQQQFQRVTPQQTLNELKHRLDELARSYKTDKVKCSRADCTSVFPATAEFFPNLRLGGKSPGRCALCHYWRRVQQRIRRAEHGGRLRKQKKLSPSEQQRFVEIETSLAKVLPNRVLARLFGLSRSAVNQRRSITLSRCEAKALFHAFQTLESAPQYPQLTDAENAIVAEEWQAIRLELPRGLWKNHDGHREFLLAYSARHPGKPRKRCKRCQKEYLDDVICFPQRWNRPRTIKRSIDTCRPCYAERWKK